MTETTVATEHVSATERLEDEAPRADARRLGDRTRIVIADDHTIMREGLRSLLEAEPEFEVVGAVDNGRDAVRLASLLKPDLVLMDLSLPEQQGLEAIREIKRRCVGTRVLVLSLHDTPQSLRAALDAGADGYLLKGASRAELVLAIAVVLRGTLFVSPALGRRPAEPALDRLTLRERQVLKRIAEGARNREIAQELALSTKTVEKHRSKLMRKLNLRNIAALTSFAIAHRITSLPSRSPR